MCVCVCVYMCMCMYVCMYVCNHCLSIYPSLICSDTPNTIKMTVLNSHDISANEDKKEEPCTPRRMTSAQRCYTIAKGNTASQEVDKCTYSLLISTYVCMYIHAPEFYTYVL